MKKTIILSASGVGRVSVLESVMRGALSFGYVVSKRSKVYDSKKEAAEMLKAHPCRKGCKVYTLNKKQAQIISDLQQSKSDLYIDLYKFLNIKQ